MPSEKPTTADGCRQNETHPDCNRYVQPHIIEAVINHLSGHKGGVAGIYNRAVYGPEKRAAIDTLASYINTAIAKAKGANVTRLKRA